MEGCSHCKPKQKDSCTSFDSGFIVLILAKEIPNDYVCVNFMNGELKYDNIN